MHRSVAVFALAVVAVLGATPAHAQGTDDGDGDAGPAQPPLRSTPTATAEVVLPELEALTGTSIAAATNDPDNGYSPLPNTTSYGPDGTEATAEANTRIVNGVLASEIVVNTLDARAVASVNAKVCPDEQGHVSAKITLNISQGTDDPRAVEVRVSGTVNGEAELTAVTVGRGTATGAVARQLERTGRAVLRQAEQGWRNGACVKVDVSEGQSRPVRPKEKVKIVATAKPRFGGGTITGRMESKLVGGKKKVSPPKTSASPAKFTYVGPDRRPEAGSVQLRAVSRRGIGIANLEYTTEGDLKIDADLGPAHLTAVKCNGPVGTWTLTETINVGGIGGSETFTMTLAAGSLSGPISSSGEAHGPPGAADTESGGSATYTESADGKSGTLAAFGSSVPVSIGKFCTNGAPDG